MTARESVLVAGGGIAGLFAALSLLEKGFSVTLVERDGPPPEPPLPDASRMVDDCQRDRVGDAFFNWPRPGAAQFRHPHAFLGLMCNFIEQHYPDLVQQLFQAGARRMGIEQMLPSALLSAYVPEPGDEKIWLLMCRRSTLETLLRRYVMAKEGIRFISHARITGLKYTEPVGQNTCHINGLMVEKLPVGQGSAEATARQEIFSADIYVDACGRTSSFRRWFGDAGIRIPEQSEDAELVYYTRYYCLNPGSQVPPRDPTTRAAGDLGYIKYGVFPADNGHFGVILCVPTGERALMKAVRQSAGFDAMSRAIPGIAPWLDKDRSHATTEPFGIADIRAVWRSYVVDGSPLFSNYFAVGDAAMRTNPLYGRGCSTSVLHAHLLAGVLAGKTDPQERARHFETVSRERLWPIFETSLMDDRNGKRRAKAAMKGEVVLRGGGIRESLVVAFREAVSSAARKNLRVARGAMRTFNLLEKPGAFLKDLRTLSVVFVYLLQGRRKNMSARMPPGPAREEMLRAIGDL